MNYDYDPCHHEDPPPSEIDKPDSAACSPRSIDLNFLGEHGHISTPDAQAMHGVMMRHCGITNPDEIVANWNRRDPEAPWGSGIAGNYVEELTELILSFMSSKIEANDKNSATENSTTH